MAIIGVKLDGDTIVSGGADGEIHVWESGDGSRRCWMRGHTGEVHAIELRGNRLVSASADTTVKVCKTSMPTAQADRQRSRFGIHIPESASKL